MDKNGLGSDRHHRHVYLINVTADQPLSEKSTARGGVGWVAGLSSQDIRIHGKKALGLSVQTVKAFFVAQRTFILFS